MYKIISDTSASYNKSCYKSFIIGEKQLFLDDTWSLNVFCGHFMMYVNSSSIKIEEKNKTIKINFKKLKIYIQKAYKPVYNIYSSQLIKW